MHNISQACRFLEVGVITHDCKQNLACPCMLSSVTLFALADS
jgi:hypothetical protein